MPACGRSGVLKCWRAASLAFLVMVLLPMVTLAQGIDTDPPTIELERVAEGVQGETQVFSATVTDNETLESVVLHFRTEADAAYTARPMTLINGTSIYTASVSQEEVASATVIQYYLEARDEGGNRTIQGFVFDPIERVLTGSKNPAAPVVAEQAPAEPLEEREPGMSTTRKIVYGALGLLVVGAIASAAGGDDGGSDGDDTPQGPDIPLTITVPPLQ